MFKKNGIGISLLKFDTRKYVVSYSSLSINDSVRLVHIYMKINDLC